MVDYHGKRWPTVIKIADMLDCVAKKTWIYGIYLPIEMFLAKTGLK